MSTHWMPLSDAAKVAQEIFQHAGRSVSRKTVSRWARDGKVQAEQRSDRWYVEADSLRYHVHSLVGHMSPPASRSTAHVDRQESADRLRHVRAYVQYANAQFLSDLQRGVD